MNTNTDISKSQNNNFPESSSSNDQTIPLENIKKLLSRMQEDINAVEKAFNSEDNQTIIFLPKDPKFEKIYNDLYTAYIYLNRHFDFLQTVMNVI